MKSNKVLVITYYWPPSGGSGVQRWLKFVKYLPQFGWKPYVFTPSNPAFDMKDPSLLADVPAEAEVIQIPIWEPYRIFDRLSALAGQKKTTNTQVIVASKRSLLSRFSFWVRANFFIPDPRVFWVRPAANFLNEFLKQQQITRIITTGPPHSVHLIGLKLKKKNPSLYWVADFRDPWSEWGLLDSMNAGKRARKKHQKLERAVLQAANEVLTVTTFYVKRFEALSGRRVRLLSNGYDEDDFKNIQFRKTPRFVVRHAGLINEKNSPYAWMRMLKAVCVERPDIRESVEVEFIGDVFADFKKFVSDDDVLRTVTKFADPIPHSKLMALYGETSALLLVITEYKGSEGYTGGKTFEYIAVGLPIIAIGPTDGEAARLLREASAGEMFSKDDTDGLRRNFLELFERWKKSPVVEARKADHPYSRKNLTQKLVTILNEAS